MTQETTEQTYPVSTPARLVVKNMRGSVDIQAGEEGVIQITAIKHTDSGDAERTRVELNQEADGTVSATARFPDWSIDWVFGSKPCAVDFMIRTPKQCTVKVNGVSNDTVLRGLEGEIDINSVSGKVDLSDLVGELKVNTVSGDLEIKNITGKMTLRTVSGGIEGQQVSGGLKLNTVSGNGILKDASLPEVDSDSVSGDVELQSPLGPGPYSFHSVSGKVHLIVPSDTRCSAELHSLSGKITSNLPYHDRTNDHGRQVMDIQDGGVQILVHSVSGKLSITT